VRQALDFPAFLRYVRFLSGILGIVRISSKNAFPLGRSVGFLHFSRILATRYGRLLRRILRPARVGLRAHLDSPVIVRRMERRGFPPDDELFKLATEAYEKMYHLSIDLHCRSIQSGVGSPPRK
jgi:hypothetical protein